MLKVLGSKYIINKGTTKKNSKLENKNVIEFYNCIKDLLQNKYVKKMRYYKHHQSTTCYQHSLNVSYYNFIICKKLKLDAKAAARAGLLHDFYLYDRKHYIRQKGERLHGYRHPEIALRNAALLFLLSDKERDIILNHMWPLTLKRPKYKETIIITLTDKYCCLAELSVSFYRNIKKQFKRIQRLFKNKR